MGYFTTDTLPDSDPNKAAERARKASLIVGAYPAEPRESGERAAFYRELALVPSIRGLELPYKMTGGAEWPPGAPATWSAIVTAIPVTMQLMATEPTFGLASMATVGRRAAVDHSAQIRNYVSELVESGHAVEAVVLHTAPRHYSAPSSLSASLNEIAAWDWKGAKVVIEHCDANSSNRSPEKGFLPIEDELQVIESLRSEGQNIGMMINWARSVIETGLPETAEQHIKLATQIDALEAVMFSGCSPELTEYGYHWIDAHLPPSELHPAPGTLLNADEMRRCLNSAGPAPIKGFKIALPRQIKSPLERADMLRQMCELVETAAVPPLLEHSVLATQ
jgi:hypothetical protein